MFANLQINRGFQKWNIFAIFVLIVIGTYAMIHFKQTTQTLQTTQEPPPTQTPLKEVCTKTSLPAVYTICTWELKKDNVISGEIHRTGQWEPHITRKLYTVLKQDRNITFIDIGANIGYFSLLAASVGQAVVSVEPWTKNIEKLRNSIRKNKFEGKITILNNAVSNDRGVIHIHAPHKDNPGATRLLSDAKVTGSNVFSAATITLNDLANYIHTKDTIIKIDIEGNECRALEKSDELFNKFNVVFISMEWDVMKKFENDIGTACPPESIKQMVEMLTKRNFVPYGFSNNLPLNPKEIKKWTEVDVYWKPRHEGREKQS
ncbi:uncharacterized protein LOC123552023 [Mercenaria mercenaria]|uniref:uncharacterized protein LOC123552023 n=1 Tax=Mercenaria mercenaria TaxID=6596 RepID=UPI00234F335E|nr:uncharacterized protein LOC123552023 [Mercenaria mercenaria]